MKRNQTGEVILAVMVVMMVAMAVVGWMGGGHMGMEQGAAQPEKSGSATQQGKTESPDSSTPQATPKYQH